MMLARQRGASPCSIAMCRRLSRLSSHLMGFFYRTIRMVENGIKPAYVFDGKPPDLKSGVVSSYIIECISRLCLMLSQLSKRFERREEAKEEGEEAKETGAS